MATNLFIGKCFELKNYKKFYCHGIGVPRRIEREKIGEAIVVIGENNKEVQFLTKNCKPIWVSKFYLKKEIPTGENSNSIELINSGLEKISSLIAQSEIESDFVKEYLFKELSELSRILQELKTTIEV